MKIFVFFYYLIIGVLIAQNEKFDFNNYFQEEYLANASSVLLGLSKSQNYKAAKNNDFELAVSRVAVSITAYDKSVKTSMIFLTFLYHVSANFKDINHAKLYALLRKEININSSANNLTILKQYGILWGIEIDVTDEMVVGASVKVKIGAEEVLVKAVKKTD